MGVVDRDGLDGLLTGEREFTSTVTGTAAAAGLAARAVSSSGLQALADATRPAPLVDDGSASWTGLEPMALMPTDLGPSLAVRDTSVDPSGVGPAALAREVSATRVGRHARPTIDPPVRRRRPTDRIVLSFVLGAAALAAAVTLVTLQSVGANEGARAATPATGEQTGFEAMRAATVAASMALAPPSPARRAGTEPAPAQRAASAAPAPVLAATIDEKALRRAPLAPPKVLQSGRLQWKLPARYSLGGEAPDELDGTSVAALVAAIEKHCEPGSVVITGHTCNVGTKIMNLVIGKRRALYARELLVASGLPAQGVRVWSAASLRPEASNATAAGRHKNRRVVVACQPQRPEARGDR